MPKAKQSPCRQTLKTAVLPAALAALAVAAALTAAPALAHFGMLIPSRPTVMETADANLTLEAKFWHPFENRGMNLVKPQSLSVYAGGQKTDLTATLSPVKLRGLDAWTASYKVERPGLLAFVLEPQPYWEPEEDCFIIHYTKVYVDAYGDDEGWNEPVGLKTEIVPLIRPGALYAGNVFTGRALVDGQPAPGTEVEMEWYPGPELAGQAPYDSLITQTTVTDEAGLFSFAAPAPGWWGFAALTTADYKLKQDGQDKDVELGGVLWLYFHEFQPAVPAAAPAK
jgi:cobalt/nickel transport protein